MTMHFTDAKAWERNLCLVGHFKDDVFAKAFSKVGCAAVACEDVEMSEEISLESTSHDSISAAATAAHTPQRFAAYITRPPKYDYTLIEFCCYEDSRLGNPKFNKGICRVVKITKELDANSRRALDLVHLVCNQDKGHVVIWGSLPCTGGCTWNYINGRTPEGQAKIKALEVMVALLDSFVKVAKVVSWYGGTVCFEWPQKCMYWKCNDVMNMIEVLKLHQTTFCGCAVCLRSFTPGNEHMFPKKPWCIYSNLDHVNRTFAKFACPGVSSDHVHDQCRGVNAKGSERYTDLFALSAHRAFRAEFGI